MLPYPLLSCLALFLFVSGIRCTEDQQLDLAQLERELIVVWVANEREDTPVVARYNLQAQQSWARLGEKYRYLPISEQEKSLVRQFSLWMIGLDRAIETGRERSVAMHLEHLRNTLTELRTPYGLEHPADHLYDFYRHWERVAEITDDQMMCLLEWGEYEDAYHLAAYDWRAYTSGGVNFYGALFPGLTQQSARAESAAVGLEEALTEFERTLPLGNHALARQPVAEVRRRFFDYLTVITQYPTAVPAI